MSACGAWSTCCCGAKRRCFRVRGKLAPPAAPRRPGPAAHQKVWPNARANLRSDDRRHPRPHVSAPIPAFPEVPRSDASAEARTTKRLSRDDVKGVRGTLRLNDGWQIVKRAGPAALPLAMHAGGCRPSGPAGFGGPFLVPAGQLEPWFPEVGGRATKWAVAGAFLRSSRPTSRTAPRAQVSALRRTQPDE